MAPNDVRSTNHMRVLRPKSDSAMAIAIMKSMLYVVLENFSERMRSSAIVESTRVVAR